MTAAFAKWKTASQLLLLSVLIMLPLTYPSRGHRKLVAEYSMQNGDIGIPGITKLYQARLINRGIIPARIQVCAYVTDTGAKGRTPAYSIERFDAQQRTWSTFASLSSPPYCQPYPLGWTKASLQDIWLWPGQYVGMEEEATGARGYLKGVSLRFVLFDSFEGVQGRKNFATESFVIDEEVETGSQGLRVKH